MTNLLSSTLALMELCKSKVLIDEDLEKMKETHGVLMKRISRVLYNKDLDANKRSVTILEEFGFNGRKIRLLGDLCVCVRVCMHVRVCV